MIYSPSIRKEELPPSGIVPRTAAQRERDIQRYAERQRQEENIRCLEARLKEQGALKSEEARRRRLENELAHAKLDIEEKGQVHPDNDQITILSSTTIPSRGEGISPSVSPISSPMKKGSSGKHGVQKHHAVVSPSTVSTAEMSKHESSFEDGSAVEIIGGSSDEYSLAGNDMHQNFPQDANAQENAFRRSKKRFAKLKCQVESLTNDADEFAQQNEQWQERLLELTMNFYVLEEEMEKKDNGIDDLIRYKQLQQEMFESLEKELGELMDCTVKKRTVLPSDELREEEVRVVHVSHEEETMEEKYEGKQNLITETIGKIQQQKDQQSPLKLSKLKGLEEFIYQFSCGECRKARYVVSAESQESLKKTAFEIIEQSARVAAAAGRNNAAVLDSSSTEQQFVQHLAAHVPPTASREADALLFCKRIIKAEKLKRRKAVE
mmetsp:Transcript_521/g.866  ORF Transcript_521/g.866 Transcript_521/m.866 type:complete len:437 (+) Transcript_521:245-1555(+)